MVGPSLNSPDRCRALWIIDSREHCSVRNAGHENVELCDDQGATGRGVTLTQSRCHGQIAGIADVRPANKVRSAGSPTKWAWVPELVVPIKSSGNVRRRP